MRRWIVLATALLVPGCTVVADLDSFEREPVCMDLRLRGFGPHPGDRTEVRVVTDQSDDPGDPPPNQLRARAVLDPLGATDVDVKMPGAVGDGPHRLDFFADADSDRTYDDPPADHTWQIRDPCAKAPIVFEHVFDFAPLPAPEPRGEDFQMTLEEMRTGEPFEVRVVELDSGQQREEEGRTVGLYYTPNVKNETFSIDGIIQPDKRYILSFWTDRNDNHRYDPPDVDDPDAPGTDEAWRLEVTGQRATDVQFRRITEYVDIGRTLVTRPDMNGSR